MLYKVARITIDIAKWFWPGVIVVFIVAYAANIAPLPRTTFVKGFSASVFGWFFLPGLNLTLTISIGLLLLALSLAAWIITIRYKKDEEEKPKEHASPTIKTSTSSSHHNKGNTAQVQESGGIAMIQGGTFNAPVSIMAVPSRVEPAPAPTTENRHQAAIHHYLRDIINKYANLIPTGIAHPGSQPLLSVSVPLDEVFIHIQAVPDRPLFDLAPERQRIQEEIKAIRERQDIPIQEREEQIQALRAALWQSEIGRDELAGWQNKRHEITIETVLQRLTAQKPVAVMLGSPGVGKSTTMRWLALQMARASCGQSSLPEALTPTQFPVLIRIDEYAKYLQGHISPTGEFTEPKPSFKAFLEQKLKQTDDALPAILTEKINKGQCLLLFDGLDEVASDTLRLHVRDDIYAYISDCIASQHTTEQFNRYIVTSRIVGYEPGPLAQYSEYTLHELTEEQIEQFLASWCPAVERYQAGKNADHSSQIDEESIREAGTAQKNKLLQAMRETPGIKQLAANPLMLTILALIQKSGGKLPHRRIELYESVAQTLLDNWNQTRGGHRFSHDEVRVAEEVLSVLAYERHNRDLLLTEQRVLALTRCTMARVYAHPEEAIAIASVKEFIETLSETSGLFGQRGQGLYDFPHRTFEEYYAALYLLNQRYYTSEQLEAFVTGHYRHAAWHEPILLAVAYLSTQKDQRLQKQANDLIQALLNLREKHDAIVQRSLLLAVKCVVDCDTLSIQAMLQQALANRLFDLYSDNLGTGRYTALREDIEQVTLLWLRGQPKESSIVTPPLLEAWHTALCNTDNNPQRQRGAAHLLAMLAPDLPNCPASVLQVLLPPLLQLADVLDIPGIPQEMLQRLPNPAAQPTSFMVAEYAFVTLRLLDKAGPAGWLHAQWLAWDKAQPELLARLSQHSLELDDLLTPAALPNTLNDPNWNKQKQLAENWQQHARRDPHDLQRQLLQASRAARYPHAYLFWQLLTAESGAPQLSWRITWDNLLQQEMQRSRGVNYQLCLYLRLLLCTDNMQKQNIADLLTTNLLARRSIQTQTLISVSNIYLIDLRDFRDLRDLRDFRDLRDLRDLIDFRDFRDLIDFRDFRDFRDLIDFRDFRDFRDLIDFRYLIGFRYLRDFRGFRYLRYLRYFRGFRHLRYLRYLRYLINKEQLIDKICHIISFQKSDITTTLFTLYSIISYEDISEAIKQQIARTLFAVADQSPTLEQRLLMKAIRQRIGSESPVQRIRRPVHSTPDERTMALDALKQQAQLRKRDAQELLAACTDSRAVSEEVKEKLAGRTWGNSSVGYFAWNLLSQAWSITPDAWTVIVQSLQEQDAVICAAAALLLQHGKNMPEESKQNAIEQIETILADEELSRRPLDPPDYTIMRLDDVLFETLCVLTEHL